MNGQNIPADASCESCRWMRPLPSDLSGYEGSPDGHCHFRSPVVAITRLGDETTAWPSVFVDDVCGSWRLNPGSA